ncbi:unnamed protein product [Citrullus colocynthis]|uniref:Uncharacterized protein n=1 Tax=Citrullus colocynthis TaxID=252529 RepID=A0ABP0Y9C3_9ROSI
MTQNRRRPVSAKAHGQVIDTCTGTHKGTTHSWAWAPLRQADTHSVTSALDSGRQALGVRGRCTPDANLTQAVKRALERSQAWSETMIRANHDSRSLEGHMHDTFCEVLNNKELLLSVLAQTTLTRTLGG